MYRQLQTVVTELHQKYLKEIHEPSQDGITFGPLIQEANTVVLNRIENTDEEIEQMKRGMILYVL